MADMSGKCKDCKFWTALSVRPQYSNQDFVIDLRGDCSQVNWHDQYNSKDPRDADEVNTLDPDDYYHDCYTQPAAVPANLITGWCWDCGEESSGLVFGPEFGCIHWEAR